MPNFFKDNKDLQFIFNNLDLREVVDIAEDSFTQAKEFNYAPTDYEDAIENYRKVLEVVGDIAGNFIAERASDVDEEGAVLKDGKVHYAKGTQENLKQLAQADLLGMIFPRKYGGLNFPFTLYVMSTELIATADASLMNIFGLQDIGDTIMKFGSEEQRQEFLPGFCRGEYTGAMALTEPDAGSDLQAVKLHAYQDEKGQWYLKGVKRFITNGNGNILLVLARSEPGTKDGRGLSMFACYGGDKIKVRRIENKLGIHGSPTCELQFNDAPAQLVGQRKFGLIKYVFDLMYRARMGVSAQALGIAQAAYGEALKYAKAREQFGKSIYNIPVVANMLIDMRVIIEANRALFYNVAQIVDLKEKLDEKINKLKAEGKPFSEENIRLKKIVKEANLLTPVVKFILTESANKITYDALQIHGGTGYMKEFKVERLARDARITNIYEGTSQLQIVAAIGGVVNDILAEKFDDWEKKNYKGGVAPLVNHLIEIREIFKDALKYVLERKDPVFQEVAAKDLVELYSCLYIGYILLDQAEIEPNKVFVANRYVLTSLANARKNAESIKDGLFGDILHAEKILA
ncbi:acyl-CoA dehydrogenase family protein [bacterium BMS3Abin03]|nr:acyl-CoA dehydrogenase family protein [bacterium BMS3Abin03]MCG6959547.1 acyl-CoA dehydrogenase family protein [bacterium BMS3Abin03]